MTERVANACPGCGKRINIWDVAFGPENLAFKCKSCGERLAKRTSLPVVFPLIFIAIAAVWLTYGRWSQDAALPMGAILAAGVAIAWFTVRIRIAEPDMPDRRPTPVGFETREGPPPFDPRFRGSSGPPPKHEG